MSKSRRTSYRNAAKSTTHATAPAAGGASCKSTPGRTGISFKPALAALRDLVSWAFELAERDVADWPEGRRRVRVSRRYLLARLRGERSQRVPVEDALFTIGLLARIAEAELGLPMNELLTFFDQLGITGKNVPSCVPSCMPPFDQLGITGKNVPSCMPPSAAPPPAPVTACDQCGQPDLGIRVAV